MHWKRRYARSLDDGMKPRPFSAASASESSRIRAWVEHAFTNWQTHELPDGWYELAGVVRAPAVIQVLRSRGLASLDLRFVFDGIVVPKPRARLMSPGRQSPQAGRHRIGAQWRGPVTMGALNVAMRFHDLVLDDQRFTNNVRQTRRRS